MCFDGSMIIECLLSLRLVPDVVNIHYIVTDVVNIHYIVTDVVNMLKVWGFFLNVFVIRVADILRKFLPVMRVKMIRHN